MLFIFPSVRGFFARGVLQLGASSSTTRYHFAISQRHALHIHGPLMCAAQSSAKIETEKSLTARERRRNAVRARTVEQINMKKDLENNSRDVIPTILMIPSFVRERCCLNARLARVKVFIERTDMNDIIKFRNQIRIGLVRFFPELEERSLLGVTDGFDIRLGGTILSTSSNDTSIIQYVLERCERIGTPLYVQVIPHNLPPPLQPYSEHVTRVKEKVQQCLNDQDLQLRMVSFYKFVNVKQPKTVAEILMKTWTWLGIKGRVYVAHEGINAQLAVPERLWNDFEYAMHGKWYERGQVVIPKEFHNVFLNVDRIVTKKDQPFEKLSVRPRDKILADGLKQPLDWTKQSGREIYAKEWHELMNQDDIILLDCRNDYESDIGRFDGAQPLNTKTFRDSWIELEKRLANQPKDKPILTYCTGGIRCVKVNAFLEQRLGFTNTARLAGGIVSYTRQLREQGQIEQSKFKGVNHVFDGRMGEVITDDLLDSCVNCGAPCNVQTDCSNVKCPRPFDKRIFVQCEECTRRLNGACSQDCQDSLVTQQQNTSTSTSTVTQCCNKVKSCNDDHDDHDHRTQYETQKQQQQQQIKTNNNNIRTITENELYADLFSTPELPILSYVRRTTEKNFTNRTHIMSSQSQALLLKLLVQISDATRVLEIGTFTGYATLCMASGMSCGSKIVTCERDEIASDIAQQMFDLRPNKSVDIILKRGQANEHIDALRSEIEDGISEQFDFVFVDADKGGYIEYVSRLLDDNIIRVGGLIVIDNVLFRGEVTSMWREEENGYDTDEEEDLAKKRLRNIKNVKRTAKKLHDFNKYVKSEKRLDQVILPFRDGVTVARRTS